jgi:hypothetical protein
VAERGADTLVRRLRLPLRDCHSEDSEEPYPTMPRSTAPSDTQRNRSHASLYASYLPVGLHVYEEFESFSHGPQPSLG